MSIWIISHSKSKIIALLTEFLEEILGQIFRLGQRHSTLIIEFHLSSAPQLPIKLLLLSAAIFDASRLLLILHNAPLAELLFKVGGEILLVECQVINDRLGRARLRQIIFQIWWKWAVQLNNKRSHLLPFNFLPLEFIANFPLQLFVVPQNLILFVLACRFCRWIIRITFERWIISARRFVFREEFAGSRGRVGQWRWTFAAVLYFYTRRVVVADAEWALKAVRLAAEFLLLMLGEEKMRNSCEFYFNTKKIRKKRMCSTSEFTFKFNGFGMNFLRGFDSSGIPSGRLSMSGMSRSFRDTIGIFFCTQFGFCCCLRSKLLYRKSLSSPLEPWLCE